MYSQHLFVPPPPLCQKFPALSPDIEMVILMALAKDPQRRLPSVQAFAFALEQAYEPTLRYPFIPPSQPLHPYVVNTPSSPSLSPTVMSPPLNQPPPPTVPVVPPSRFPQPSVADPLPSRLQPPKRRLSRQTVLSMAGLAVVGGGLTLLALSQNHQASPSLSSLGTTEVNILTSTPSIAVGTRLNFFEDTGGIRALAWSRDSRFIAAANDDNTVPVWDVNAKKLIYTYRGHLDHVEGVSWSPDGKYILSGSADGTARIWNVQTGETRYVYTGHTVVDVYAHHVWVNRVQWSPDGTKIVSCDQTSSGALTATVQVWDANTGEKSVTYSEHQNGVYSVAWSPNNQYIASVGYDGTLRMWEATAPSGKTLVMIPGSSRFLFGVAWSPDGKYVAFGGTDSIVWVISSDGQQKIALYTLPHTQGWGIRDIAWSPKGKYIAVSTDGQGIHIIKSDTGTLIYKTDTLAGDISALGWSPTDARIASGNGGGTPYAVQVWQAPGE